MLLSEEIQSYCDSRKMRSAAKRIIVANELLMSGQFLDGDTLWRALRTNGIKISPATVYDSLNWLFNAGFAERKNDGERKNLFGIREEFRRC